MLHAYMGYSRRVGAREGACLIFANTGKEAKKLAYPTICDWFDAPWIDVAVKRLNAPHLFHEADTEKLSAGKPHVVESPKVCPVCQGWGGTPLPDGRAGCDFCDGNE